MSESLYLSRRAKSVLGVAVLAATAGWGLRRAVGTTQNAVWNDATTDTYWGTAGNWSPTGVPNNGTNGFSDYNVSIGAPSPTNLNVNATIDNLTINSGGVLGMFYSYSLTVNGPSLVDNGSILVNSNTGGAVADLNFGANTSMTGSGSISLLEGGTNSELTGTGGAALTVGSNNTIGGLGNVSLPVINNGNFSANVSGNVLSVTVSSTNNLNMTAVNGGYFNFSGTTLTQGTNGVLNAATGSFVYLTNANVSGGTLRSVGTGSVQISGTSTLTNVTSLATIDIPYSQQLNVTGTLVDSGSIVVNSNNGGAVAALNFGTGSVVSGTGNITLQFGGGDALLEGSLTQSAGHTIQGLGTVNAALINNGLVNANINSNTLTLQGYNGSNNLTFEATSGGTLNISGINVSQGTNGVINAGSGSFVTITNSNISAGLITSTGGGQVTINGTSTFTAITSSAAVLVPYSNVLSVSGNLIDNGSILVNQNGGGAVAEITFNGGTLSGTGTLTLNSYGTNAQLEGSLTQSAGHSIVGYGQIDAALVNNGIINANSSGNTLLLTTSNKTNNLTFEATAGGTMNISGITVTQGTNGVITAANGSSVVLNASTISGGTLVSAGTGLITINNTTVLSSVTNNAAILVPYYNGVLSVVGNLVDNGTILVNQNGGGAVAEITFGGSVLSGTGTITLNSYQTNAQIEGSFNQSAGHSVVGYGQIDAATINNGIINANVNGSSMVLTTANKTNNLTIEATNGGNVNISGITITQNTTGVITAANASTVSLNSANISGGSIASTGSGSFTIGGTTVLNSVNSSAAILVPFYNGVLDVVGNLTDNGSILVNQNGGGAVAEILVNGGTISGNGTITLNSYGTNAQIEGTLTQSAGHSIVGYGQIDAAFTNNGLVNTNISGQALVFATSNKTNNSLIEATGGGNIVVSGITLTQSTAGLLNLGSGSTLTLNTANISGGTINGPGTLTINDANSTLANLTTSAVIDIPYYYSLMFTGTVVDNGTIVVNSNLGGAVAALNFSGGTINGTGTINLAEGTSNSQVNGPFTQGVGHSIVGEGQVNGAFTNAGTVNANVSTATLYVTGTASNSGRFQASNGGILSVTTLSNLSGTTLTGGTYEADAGSTLLLPGTVVTNAANIVIGGPGETFAAVTPLGINQGSLTILAGGSFPTAGNLTSSGTVTTAGPSGNNAGGILTVNGQFNQTAGGTVDNGSIVVTGATNISAGLVTVGFGATFAGTPITVGSNATLTANGSLSSSPVLTDNGTVTLAATSGTGILTRAFTSITIGSGGLMTDQIASSHSNRTLITTNTLSDSGKLDLGNNDLDISGSSLAGVTALLTSGYNFVGGGNWSGTTGITSAAAAGDTRHLTALGVIQNNQGGSAIFTSSNKFDGYTPGAGDILVKYTYAGDANLSGKVDGSDYSLIDFGYLADRSNPTAKTGWYNGDFNYDGIIDGSDFALIDNSFNNQSTDALAAALVATETAQVAGNAAPAAVPEPASAVGLLAAASIGLRIRRRRPA